MNVRIEDTMDNVENFVFDVPERSNDPKEIWSTRELVIFLIDCTDRMFEIPADGLCPFKRCIQFCRSILVNKIIGSSSDLLGIVLYGTREKDLRKDSPKHLITLTEPKQPNADIIKQLETLIKLENQKEFDNKYGHSDDYSLADVFWYASSLISHCTTKVGVKTLILLTCSENPHANSPMNQHQARKKAEDLENLGIHLDVIPLSENFNGDTFYNEIMQILNGPQSRVEPGEAKINEVLERQYRKDRKKRNIAKFSWNLGHDVVIGVDLYNFYSSLTIPPICKLDRKTNQIVKNVTQMYSTATGERLLKSDLKQKIEVCSEDISFDIKEKDALHIHEKPGLTLLGFKSIYYLSPEYNIHSSSFIYPSDENIKGSTILFYALLKSCLEKDKFALCYMIQRVRSKPKLVALVSQEEVRDDTKQIIPPGFHVIYLPYAENIRQIEVPKQLDLDSEKVDLCKKILKKISLKYKVSMFENPKVQTHWANIEALALNYSKPREVIDKILPNFEYVSQCRLKNLEDEFVDTFYKDGYNPEAESSRKRKYPAYSASTLAKVQKFDPSDVKYVEKMAIAGMAEKLTVPVLKKYLTEERGMSVGGFKKNDLINADRKSVV